MLEARHAAQRCGLAAAGRSQQNDDLAGFDAKVHVVHGGDAGAEHLAQPFDLQFRRHCCLLGYAISTWKDGREGRPIHVSYWR